MPGPRRPHLSCSPRGRAQRGCVHADQALAALLFLYRKVLNLPLAGLGQIERARKPARLPVVLTRAEVKAVLSRLQEPPAPGFRC